MLLPAAAAATFLGQGVMDQGVHHHLAVEAVKLAKQAVLMMLASSCQHPS